MRHRGDPAVGAERLSIVRCAEHVSESIFGRPKAKAVTTGMTFDF
jgi:hypothetical protein